MLTPSFDLIRFLILIFASLGLAQANYIIDDTNSSVQYTPSIESLSTGSWWPLTLENGNRLIDANGSTSLIDYSRIYNQSMTVAKCNTSQQCQLSIPFTGTGITIYGLVFPGGSNFAVMLDGKTAPAPNVMPLVPEGSAPIYNATLYDIQMLPFMSHDLTISVVSYANGFSDVAFDYASVNVTSASVSSNQSSFPVGAVVGGVVGGLAVIAAIIVALVCFRRRRRAPIVLETGRNFTSFDPYEGGPQPQPTPQPVMTYGRASSLHGSTTLLHPPSPWSNISAQRSYNLQSESPSTCVSVVGSMPQTNVADCDDVRSNATSSPAKDLRLSLQPQVTNSSPSNQLTNEQVNFVHDLYSHNIPGPAIARVMERIMGGQEAGGPGGGLTRGNTTATMEPPSYTDTA